MKYAADFRKIARNALYGKWKLAILVCVIALFVLVAATSVLFIIGLQDMREATNDKANEEAVVEQVINGKQYQVSTMINGSIFSNEFWDTVNKIEYYEGSDYPYVVTDKAVIQEIGLLIKNLEHKEVEKPMLEGGWFFDVYTEEEMSSIWISDDIIDFNGINYQVPTENPGDNIRALIMDNYEMSIRVDEYVTNDYRINILDKPKESDLLVDMEIKFLTDKEKHILQNTINVENQGTVDLTVKISDETERTKVVNAIADGYELTFKFDVNTYEVFDIRKVTEQKQCMQ